MPCSSSIFRVEPRCAVANAVNSLVMRIPASHFQPVQVLKCRMNFSIVNPTDFFVVAMLPPVCSQSPLGAEGCAKVNSAPSIPLPYHSRKPAAPLPLLLGGFGEFGLFRGSVKKGAKFQVTARQCMDSAKRLTTGTGMFALVFACFVEVLKHLLSSSAVVRRAVPTVYCWHSRPRKALHDRDRHADRQPLCKGENHDAEQRRVDPSEI